MTKKVAICVSGIGRSIDYVFENNVKNLFNCWDHRDIYVFIGKSKFSDNAYDKFKTLTNCNILIEEEADLDLSNITFMPGWPPSNKSTKPNYQTIAKFLNARFKVGEMMNSSGNTYDMVISARDDMIYEKPLSETIDGFDMSKLWMPDIQHCLNGYNDKLSISNQEYQTIYMDLWNHISEYCSTGQIPHLHAEQTLRYHLDKNIGMKKLKTFSVKYNRVRPDGEIHSEHNWPGESRYL